MKNKRNHKQSFLSSLAVASDITKIEIALSSLPANAPERKAPKVNPFGMVKTQISEDRKNRIFHSIQHFAIMAEIMKIEYRVEMDVDFRDPYLNNLATRIGRDCLDLASRIEKGSLVQFKVKDQDYPEEYATELHRVFKLFIGMEIEKIRELMDGWEQIAEKVEEAGDLNYITMGFTPEELEEIGRVVKRKGISDSLRTKFEAVLNEANKK